MRLPPHPLIKRLRLPFLGTDAYTWPNSKREAIMLFYIHPPSGAKSLGISDAILRERVSASARKLDAGAKTSLRRQEGRAIAQINCAAPSEALIGQLSLDGLQAELLSRHDE